MGELQQILRSRLGLLAALCVAGTVFVALVETHALMRTNAQALSFSAAPVPVLSSSGSADEAQERLLLGSADTFATSSGDAIAMIGPVVIAQLAGSYAGLQDSGAATPENLTQTGEAVAKNMRAIISAKTFALTDIHTKNDTSYQSMLQYRADMRVALQPLLENAQNELDLYGSYIETNDASYLAQLAAAAQNYRIAADAAAALIIPKDAINYHKDILNALEAFASVLDQMSSHPGSSLTSAALLRTYSQAEQDVYNTFNNLTKYYSQKTPS